MSAKPSIEWTDVSWSQLRAENERLLTENERLRAALKPFADAYTVEGLVEGKWFGLISVPFSLHKAMETADKALRTSSGGGAEVRTIDPEPGETSGAHSESDDPSSPFGGHQCECAGFCVISGGPVCPLAGSSPSVAGRRDSIGTPVTSPSPSALQPEAGEASFDGASQALGKGGGK